MKPEKCALIDQTLQNYFIYSCIAQFIEQTIRSVPLVCIACNGVKLAHPQFNVLSGGLAECLDEPRHVGVCAAESFTTATLLSIPQWVTGVDRCQCDSIAILSTSLAVVVSTNMRELQRWNFVYMDICPNVFAWRIAIGDGYTIDINIVNGAGCCHC